MPEAREAREERWDIPTGPLGLLLLAAVLGSAVTRWWIVSAQALAVPATAHREDDGVDAPVLEDAACR